jgi:flagellar FliJ protein
MASRRFEFRLERVLEYRRRVEEQAQAELGRLEMARAQAEGERRALDRRRAEAQEQHRELHRGELDLIGENLQRLFIRELDRRVAAKLDEIRRLAESIEGQRAEVVRTARDRRVMEQLRERAYARYLEEQMRLEQRFLDEIGTQAFVRERILSAAEPRAAGECDA